MIVLYSLAAKELRRCAILQYNISAPKCGQFVGLAIGNCFAVCLSALIMLSREKSLKRGKHWIESKIYEMNCGLLNDKPKIEWQRNGRLDSTTVLKITFKKNYRLISFKFETIEVAHSDYFIQGRITNKIRKLLAELGCFRNSTP